MILRMATVYGLLLYTHSKLAYTMIHLSALDTAVIQGGSARFECGYAGHESIIWKINEAIYTSLTLPQEYSVLEGNDFSLLMIRNATIQMNGSTYQCIAGSMRSSNVHLQVFPASKNCSVKTAMNQSINTAPQYKLETASTSPFSTAIQVTQTVMFTKTLFVSNRLHNQNTSNIVHSHADNTDNCFYHHSDGPTAVTIIMVGIMGPIIFFILGCGSFGVILLLKKGQHKQGRTQVVTRQNEAYQIVNAQGRRNKLRPQAVSPIYEEVQ